MVKVKEDLTGRKFDRLTVLEQDEDYITPKGLRFARWKCQCSCKEHNIISVIWYSLTRNDGRGTRSCGCLCQEIHKQRLKKYNRYNLSGEYGIGWTINTNREFYFDLEDYDLIKDYCWHEHKSNKDDYSALEAYDSNTKTTIKMHYLMGFKGYDHMDCNPFNNRKENLRFATKSQNSVNRSKQKNNTSGIMGVYWHKRDEVWVARIGINGKQVNLGYFIDKIDAIRTRLKAEKEYFGEFAPQKHLYEQYSIN